MRLLTLVRHGKSDWSVDCDDRHRPLNARGRRQAPITGAWIGAHLPPVDAAVVSPAVRTQMTWDLLHQDWKKTPPVEVVEDLYTFSGLDVIPTIRALAPMTRHAVLVGHNPAVEELVTTLTGEQCVMKTSARAVIAIHSSWTFVGQTPARLVIAGRPDSVDLTSMDKLSTQSSR